jgi:hypothetical protein
LSGQLSVSERLEGSCSDGWHEPLTLGTSCVSPGSFVARFSGRDADKDQEVADKDQEVADKDQSATRLASRGAVRYTELTRTQGGAMHSEPYTLSDAGFGGQDITYESERQGMHRIDERTVELTDEEMSASKLFEEESFGVDSMVALAAVLKVYPDLSDEFQSYLVR